MKKVFKEVGTFDKKCYERYLLSEDLLMEHAALGLKSAIEKKIKKDEKILIVSGPGNNGADGIALARMLQNQYAVDLYLPYGAKSKMAQLQLQRAKTVGVTCMAGLNQISPDFIVDALFGSGLNKALDQESQMILKQLNSLNAFKIACDIPSGIDIDGNVRSVAFKADLTVTMGALKEALFMDSAKEYVGEILCVDLGVSQALYEGRSDTFLLETDDMKLPIRTQRTSHKGDFGHLSVIMGKKQGAGIIAAKAAFAFGSGLVTVVENEPYNVPYELMYHSTLPPKSTAVCIGMGLGNHQYDAQYLANFLLHHNLPLLIDADLFYQEIILKVLEKKPNVVLTPHPKEFTSLLRLTGIADISVEEVQQRRFELVRTFTAKYKGVVLLLKGANTLVSKNGQVFIQPFGTNALSKGGSGDVLSGMIAALLAQNYDTLEAAISGALAHALAAKNFEKNNYALSPLDLIEGIKCL